MPRRREPRERLEAQAVARALADDRPGRLERKILEELIYERVRVTVDLCELMDFELDLAASIERALSVCAEAPGERADLTLDYLHRAWERMTCEVLGGLAERELGGSRVERDERDDGADLPQARAAPPD
jgi:hypothetical protein